MAQPQNIEEILNQAIQFEEDAYTFYTGAVEMVTMPHVQETLRDLASEETKHKEKLQELLQGNVQAAFSVDRQQIQDLKLAEYLVPKPLDKDATFQDILVVAMHREKSSHSFYSTMADLAPDEELKRLFEFLAQEELGHKNKIETLYDEIVYQEF